MLLSQSDIYFLLQLVTAAGQAILDVQQGQALNTRHKHDDSPVTAADMAAHQRLCEGLSARFGEIPILSEEDSLPDWNLRQSWSSYWLMDPLDGTREFLQGNGEFTVNLALIQAHQPVFGIVYAPEFQRLWWGGPAWGAWEGMPPAARSLHTRRFQDPLTLLTSRRHSTREAIIGTRLIEAGVCTQLLTPCMGSSMKMCLIAAGEADVYPRVAPTSEWDTAAAQAILTAAGGALLHLETLQPLSYNTKSDLTNPSFIALGDLTTPSPFQPQRL